MARKSLWIGLDVGADVMSVCATDNGGAVVLERSIETNAKTLHRLLKPNKRRIKLIGLESGSFGMALCRSLLSLGYPVAMFEARQASHYLAIRKNKTDRNDARGLADIARLGRDSVSEVRLKTPESQRLRSTLATRRKLVQLSVTLEATMRSLFRLNGGKLTSSHSAAALRRNVSAELTRLRKCERVDLSDSIEPLLALSAAMRTYVETLDVKLAKQADEDPVCRRFLEIPGVGPLTALAFRCAIDDPHRFHRNSDVGAYLGFVPRIRQSGQSLATLRISKMGDVIARTYLTTAAQHHLNHAESSLADWGAALSHRLKKGGVHVAMARKLAVMMLAIWKSGERYEPYHAGAAAKTAESMKVHQLPRGAAGRETATTTDDDDRSRYGVKGPVC